MTESMKLEKSKDVELDLWKQFQQFYQKGEFVDLEVICSGSSIYCHQLVMAAVSNTFYSIMRMSSDSDVITVVMPDFSVEEVKKFFDDIYNFLGNGHDVETLNVPKSMNDMLQIRQPGDQYLPLPSVPGMPPPVMEPIIKMELKDDENDEIPDYHFNEAMEMEWWMDSQPKKKRGRKRKQEVELKREDDDDDLALDEKFDLDDLEKPKRRKKGRYPYLDRTFEDVQEVSDINERMQVGKILSDATATLEVEIYPEPMDINIHLNKHHRQASFFLAMIGIARTDHEDAFKARPLAWSFPKSEDIPPQFNSIFDAYRAVFGFSNGDICYTGLMYSRQGLYSLNRGRKVKHDLKRRYAKLSDEEMEELVTKPEVLEVLQRYPMKPAMTSKRHTCQFQLDSSIPPQNLDGVALVTWRKDTGDIEARILNVSQDKRESQSYDCMRAVFEVWSLERQMRIPKCDYLRKRYNELINPMETFSIYKDFKADVDKKQRTTILQKERQCPDCGKVFECVTVDQDLKFNLHRRTHYYENFKCDCDYESLSTKGKINHVKLVHSNGKYSQCPYCEYVGTRHLMAKHNCHITGNRSQGPVVQAQPDTKRQLKFGDVGGFICCEQHFPNHEDITNHVKQFHTMDKYVRCDKCHFLGEVIGVVRHKKAAHVKLDGSDLSCMCETCGKALVDEKALNAHMLTHKEFECEMCGVRVVGLSSFNTHQKNAHNMGNSNKFPCEVCGKEFPAKTKLKHHFIRKHMEDKDCPFQCDQCGRGFPHRYALTSHQMMAHIKSRPFRCRYGCGADYNDHASRGTHELKKHGARFPNEKLAKKNQLATM